MFLKHLSTECGKQGPKEYAVLNIVLNSPQMLQTMKDVKVTFSDQLGILGNVKVFFCLVHNKSKVKTL